MGFLSRWLKRRPESVRQARFRGHLYPERDEAIRERVERALQRAAPAKPPRGALKAMIVPFAELGYIEEVLGRCWAQVAAQQERIERVALIGSATRVPFQGVAVSATAAWEVPGWPDQPAWVDEVWREQIATLELARAIEAVHEPELALEAQLAFLRAALHDDQVTILPLLMGDGSAEPLQRLIEVLAEREGSLIVVATELCYGAPSAQSEALIERATGAILNLEAAEVSRQEVSAAAPVRALLKVAAARAWRPRCVGTTTSAEAQQRSSEQLIVQDQGLVTGYGGFLFEQA